jgi:agmatine deiminase
MNGGWPLVSSELSPAFEQGVARFYLECAETDALGPCSLSVAVFESRGMTTAAATNATTPSASAAGYRFPAEWAAHRTCYTAWPAHEYAWGPALRAAQQEFVGFVRAFTAEAGQEPLTILVDDEHAAEARAALADVASGWQLLHCNYGDVWLRDTGPLFLLRTGGASDAGQPRLAHARFRFNGWGEKFIYPHDDSVAERLTALHPNPGPAFTYTFVLEGGAIDVDGAGTCLTTRSCLQNPNRGAPPPSDAVVSERLQAALGIEHVIWLDAGLANDHTDGHIDNIARFVSEGVVVCMQAHDDDDPNRDTLDAIARTLQSAHTAAGKPLQVVRIPSPGRVLGAEGQVIPASYMNFYIGNRSIVMPAFGTRWDAPAQAALQKLFPRQRVVATSARAILEGGGTFHCMTQQEPSV